MKLSLRRLLLTLAAPVLAIVVAFVVTSLVLVLVGDPVGKVWSTLLSEPRPRTMVNIINSGITYYIAAVAVAVSHDRHRRHRTLRRPIPRWCRIRRAGQHPPPRRRPTP